MADKYKRTVCPKCGSSVLRFIVNERQWLDYEDVPRKVKLQPHRCPNTTPVAPSTPNKIPHYIISIERVGCKRCEAEVWEVWWKNGNRTLYDDEERTRKHRCDPAVSGRRSFNRDPNKRGR